MWAKRRKTLLVISGTLYVVFGVLAFFDIPGGHDEHHHTLAHNLTHIVLGLVLLAVTLRTRPAVRQGLCFGFAAAYFLIGAIGLSAGRDVMLQILPRIIEFHAGDYGVHLATGLFFLALGFFKRSDERLPKMQVA
jgi:hypothetical protein